MDGFIRDIKKVNLKAVGAMMSYMNLKTAKHEPECECKPCLKSREELKSCQKEEG